VLALFVCVFALIIYVYASVAVDLFRGVLGQGFKYDVDDPTGPDDDVTEAEVVFYLYLICGHILFYSHSSILFLDFSYFSDF
jgi:hypothetical protein